MFSVGKLLYPPRNVRAHRLHGMSPVQQIALTINIALRRDAALSNIIARAPCLTLSAP